VGFLDPRNIFIFPLSKSLWLSHEMDLTCLLAGFYMFYWTS